MNDTKPRTRAEIQAEIEKLQRQQNEAWPKEGDRVYLAGWFSKPIDLSSGRCFVTIDGETSISGKIFNYASLIPAADLIPREEHERAVDQALQLAANCIKAAELLREAKRDGEGRVMSDELKPCPFCGGVPHIEQFELPKGVIGHTITHMCHVRVSVGNAGETAQHSITAWNNRAEVPAGWRPIPKEVDTSNPPFDGSEVLIWGEGQDGAYLAIYEADTNEPWKIADTHPSGWTPLVDAPTHWMPLPAPPESEADRD